VKKNKKILIIIGILIVLFISAVGGAISDRFLHYRLLNRWFPEKTSIPTVTQKIVREESIVIDIAEKTSPAVVTIGISKTQKFQTIDPFDFFSFFNSSPQTQKIEQDIGTGFIVDSNGLIITNKHVVADLQAQYRIITAENKTYQVEKIYRDPSNDLAILKISAQDLAIVSLGTSENLKVGQFVMAIGTALGEFRHTVTTGVISGLGRGITAGSPFQGYIEKLDNVIQTDAAINSGNSGGPLLNSAGQVIGINVAVAQEAQNIGFAIPVDVVKTMLKNFKETGQFARPFLGIHYSIVTQKTAILNEIPEGAYIIEIIADSAAAEAGLKKGDIITAIDDEKINQTGRDISEIINQKKVGEQIKVVFWRQGEKEEINIVLKTSQ